MATNGKRTPSRRVAPTRYTATYEHQDATLEWCHQYVAERWGRRMTPQELDHLKASVGTDPEVLDERSIGAQMRRSAREATRGLQAALLQARAVTEEYAKQRDRSVVPFDADAERLQRAMEDHGGPLLKRVELNPAVTPEPSVGRSTGWTLIDTYDRPHMWWWGEAPTLRDLAVLSILAADHWPETSGTTVMDAINAEARALAQTRRRIKLRIVGKRIRQRREELGLSRAQLARELRIERALLARYENNSRVVPGPRLQAIARILKCEESWLRGEDGAPPPPMRD